MCDTVHRSQNQRNLLYTAQRRDYEIIEIMSTLIIFLAMTHFLGTVSRSYNQQYTAITASLSTSYGFTCSKNSLAPGCARSSQRIVSLGMGQSAFGSQGGGRGRGGINSTAGTTEPIFGYRQMLVREIRANQNHIHKDRHFVKLHISFSRAQYFFPVG